MLNLLSLPLTWAPSHNPLKPSFDFLCPVTLCICVTYDLKSTQSKRAVSFCVIYSSFLSCKRPVAMLPRVIPVLFCASFLHKITSSTTLRDQEMTKDCGREMKMLKDFKPRQKEDWTLHINIKACAVTEAYTDCSHFSVWAI